MKIKQLTSYPNPNELGLGNTNETYIRVENSLDVSDIFPIGKEINVINAATKDSYSLKSKVEIRYNPDGTEKSREFRLNQLGAIYRDFKMQPGDEIKFTCIEQKRVKTVFFSVTNYKRAFLNVSTKGTEVVNKDILSNYYTGFIVKHYDIPISEGQLVLEFEKKEKKRSDSPSETEYYSSKVNNVSLSKGTYYVTIGESGNSLEEVKKNAVEEFTIPDISFNSTVPFSSDVPRQQIFYGAPGTGKSHEIKNQSSMFSKVVRTTFHPDSDYASFVGTYKPKTVGTDEDKKIIYNFTAQAFTKAYIAAWNAYAKGEIKPVLLDIEEINRGNCAQIFGDIFQLLDRADNGFSDYPILADQDLQDHLKGLLSNLDINIEGVIGEYQSPIDDEEVHTLTNDVKTGKVLILPPNLFIWATMNTSDQSLFPMDSAFKRRWEWKYVPIKDEKKGHYILIKKDGDTELKYSWGSFLKNINDRIKLITNSEDKKLGYYFVKADIDKTSDPNNDRNGVISADLFVNKILFYLYNDVFKRYANHSNNPFRLKGEKEPLQLPDFYKVNEDSIDQDKLIAFLEALSVDKI